MTEIQKRQPAYVVDIEEIVKGEFTKTGGWDPNFVTTSFGLKVSRIMIFGTVVEVDSKSITMDDSTEMIELRSFEDFEPFENIKSGDFVMVIGKVRQFNSKTYIFPEVCNKVDPFWIMYKNKTKEKIKDLFKEEKIIQNEFQEVVFNSGKEIVEEIVNESVLSTTTNSHNLVDDILKYIDSEDSGNGVEKVKILDHFNSPDVSEAIDSLIMEGDIFEIKPGIFKVLK